MTPGVCEGAFFAGGVRQFSPVITSTTLNYNVSTAAIADGWDGTSPILITLTIAAAGRLSSSNTTLPALDIPTLPAGSIVNVVIDGLIAGRGGNGGAGGSAGGGDGGPGGAGGPAIRARYPFRLTGSGTYAGGGGGGGGGSGVRVAGQNGQVNAAGGMGGGGGEEPFTSGGSAGQPGQTVYGGGVDVATGGAGGAGGAAGMPGSNGLTGTGTGGPATNGAVGVGGAAGLSIDGYEFADVTGFAGVVKGPVGYSSNSYIATPAATPSMGAAFEGGYYGGLLWQSLATSTTPLTIGTGQVSLSVPAMQGAPMVYGGQFIKLVSLSNPSRYMQGTVSGAANGNLTLQITTQSGAGNTHSDWVVMSRFRQIYAPKATGETTLAIAVGALPDAAWCLHEPQIVGAAMRAAGDSSAFPAAHWVAGLTIGGRSDWEVPTRDVQELAQRNLKSSTTNNYVTADRPTAPSKSYGVLGSQADVSASQGVNTNTALTGTAYTTNSPARIGVAAFQLPSGAEAFDLVQYGCVTAYDANNVWVQSMDTATTYGRQYAAAKGAPVRVRAVRRSII